MSSNLKAIVLSLLGFALFAFHDVIVKILGGTYPTFQIVFFSVLMGFPLVTLLLLQDRTRDTLIPKHPWWSLFRTFLVVTAASSGFYAFSTLPLAQTYALLFAFPLIITLASIPMLGEVVGWRRMIAVCVGFAGVLIVLQPGTAPFGIGHLAALIAATCSALASVIVRKIGQDERSIVLILYPMMANVLLMAAVLPWVYVPMPIIDLGLTFAISLLALLATICMITAYKIGEPAVVAPMQYSQILWATFFGVMYFDETLTTATFLGAAVVISSGLYIVVRETSASNTKPVLRTRSRLATPSTPRVGVLLREEEKARFGR